MFRIRQSHSLFIIRELELGISTAFLAIFISFVEIKYWWLLNLTSVLSSICWVHEVLASVSSTSESETLSECVHRRALIGYSTKIGLRNTIKVQVGIGESSTMRFHQEQQWLQSG